MTPWEGTPFQAEYERLQAQVNAAMWEAREQQRARIEAERELGEARAELAKAKEMATNWNIAWHERNKEALAIQEKLVEAAQLWENARRACAFFKSAIKCGEPWTLRCEEEYLRAMGQIK